MTVTRRCVHCGYLEPEHGLPYPYARPAKPIRHRRRYDPYDSLAYNLIKVSVWGVSWLLRGSTYGIWLCLRGQLSVPPQGWHDIGRGVKAVIRDADKDALRDGFFYLLPLGIVPIFVLAILMLVSP